MTQYKQLFDFELLAAAVNEIDRIAAIKSDTIQSYDGDSDGAIEISLGRLMMHRNALIQQSQQQSPKVVETTLKKLETSDFFLPIYSQLHVLYNRYGVHIETRIQMIKHTLRQLILFEYFNGISIKDLDSFIRNMIDKI